MRYAETGFNLEVDLARGNIERVATDPRLTALHLGGLGTNAKLFWDRVPPEVGPFDPENLLIFGLLVGTPAPSCNRTVVSTISPQTGLFGFSMMGGFFGPELKRAGYDKIVIRGKSPTPVYLWIHDDHVELRDAGQLMGLGALGGAAAGGWIDAALGGSSLLAGALTGAGIGAVSAALAADRLVEVKVLHIPLGSNVLVAGPSKNVNFPHVVFERARIHHALVSGRSHAVREEKLSLDTVRTLLPALDGKERKSLEAAFNSLRRGTGISDDLARTVEEIFADDETREH